MVSTLSLRVRIQTQGIVLQGAKAQVFAFSICKFVLQNHFPEVPTPTLTPTPETVPGWLCL